VLLEATHDLCRLDHTQLVITILTDMIGNPAGTVRVLVAQLLAAVLPFTNQQLLTSRLIPSVITLVNDQNRDVKLQVSASCPAQHSVDPGGRCRRSTRSQRLPNAFPTVIFKELNG
jgi:hypothetical protein